MQNEGESILERFAWATLSRSLMHSSDHLRLALDGLLRGARAHDLRRHLTIRPRNGGNSVQPGNPPTRARKVQCLSLLPTKILMKIN